MFLTRIGVLLLSLLSATGSDAPVEMAPELRIVTCASALKLQHSQTKSRLHSHEIAYVHKYFYIYSLDLAFYPVKN